MRSEHLRYLLEIEKCHSISVAAQKLYLSQTTLSTTLKSIEEELGFKVFNRTRSGVQTTLEGEAAIALISEINQRLDEIYQIRNQTQASTSSIPIILSPTICSGLALPLYEMLSKKNFSGNISFQTISGEEIGTKLIKNEGRIGLTYFNQGALNDYRMIADKYQIKIETLFWDQFYLLVSKKNPLATFDSILCENLKNLHFVGLPNYNNNDNFLAFPQYLGANNRHTIFSDVATIKKAVLEQGMVAILSGYAIQYNNSCDNHQLKAIRLAGLPLGNSMQLCLIHRSDKDLHYQEKLVIQCIKEYFEGLQPPPFAPRTHRIAPKPKR